MLATFRVKMLCQEFFQHSAVRPKLLFFVVAAQDARVRWARYVLIGAKPPTFCALFWYVCAGRRAIVVGAEGGLHDGGEQHEGASVRWPFGPTVPCAFLIRDDQTGSKLRFGAPWGKRCTCFSMLWFGAREDEHVGSRPLLRTFVVCFETVLASCRRTATRIVGRPEHWCVCVVLGFSLLQCEFCQAINPPSYTRCLCCPPTA